MDYSIFYRFKEFYLSPEEDFSGAVYNDMQRKYDQKVADWLKDFDYSILYNRAFYVFEHNNPHHKGDSGIIYFSEEKLVWAKKKDPDLDYQQFILLDRKNRYYNLWYLSYKDFIEDNPQSCDKYVFKEIPELKILLTASYAPLRKWASQTFT